MRTLDGGAALISNIVCTFNSRCRLKRPDDKDEGLSDSPLWGGFCRSKPPDVLVKSNANRWSSQCKWVVNFDANGWASGMQLPT